MTMTKEKAIENARNYFQEVQASKMRKAQEFCDTTVDKAIEQASKEGERQYSFYRVDLEIIYEACGILKNQGFNASIQGTTLFVKWYN